jgi:putative peptidoglycan lipid II flippase
MIIHFLGASTEMDAFTTAFKFPSFFRRFFAEGGFQSIFVPYFTDFTATNKLKGARYFSSRIFTLTFWIVVFITAIVLIFTKQFTIFMAPGFINMPEKLALTVDFTRIIFPSVAFISLATIYSGILVSYKKFFLFAFAPVLVNCVLVCSILIGQDMLSTGYRLSYGTLASGVLQFIYLYVCVKTNKLPSPKISLIRCSAKIKSFLKKLLPVLAGAGVAQVNILVGLFLASLLPTGCITYMHCADRFIQLPLSLFGASMGIVLLPEISANIAKNKFVDLKNIQNKSMLFVLRLTLPSVIGLIVLSDCLISLLYGHGKFDNDAVKTTSLVLKVTAVGLPAYVISKIMSFIFFAQKNSKVPVMAAIVSVISNILFGLALIGSMKILGLAIANALSGFINVCIMCYKSNRWFSLEKETLSDCVKIISASLFMLLIMLLIQRVMYADNAGFCGKLTFVIISFVTAVIAYVFALYFFKDHTVRESLNLLKNKISKNQNNLES